MDTLVSLGGIGLPVFAAAYLIRCLAVVAFAIVAVGSEDEVRRTQAMRVVELLLARAARPPQQGSDGEPKTPPP